MADAIAARWWWWFLRPRARTRGAAEATRANVERHFTDDIRLTLTGDGRGFAPPDVLTELADTGILGLLGMQEWAHLVGAQLDIASRPGQGTRVAVTVPR